MDEPSKDYNRRNSVAVSLNQTDDLQSQTVYSERKAPVRGKGPVGNDPPLTRLTKKDLLPRKNKYHPNAAVNDYMLTKFDNY